MYEESLFGQKNPEMKNSNAEHFDQKPIEFDLLMSLTLDDLLDESQDQEFADELAQYPLLAERWELWQEIDQKLYDAPSIAPPSDFVQKIESQLLSRNQKQRFRFGVIVAGLTVLLWGSLIIGLVMLGSVVIQNQGVWLSNLIHNLAYSSAMVLNLVDTVVTMGTTLLGTPQLGIVLISYTTLLMIILAGWTQFLRRSLQHSWC